MKHSFITDSLLIPYTFFVILLKLNQILIAFLQELKKIILLYFIYFFYSFNCILKLTISERDGSALQIINVYNY